MSTTTILLYDDSWDGLLTAIFEAYRLGLGDPRFVPAEEFGGSLFDTVLHITTDPALAERVRQGVQGRTSPAMVERLYRAFLTEQAEVERLIYGFIRQAMTAPHNLEENYVDPTVRELYRLDGQIGRELHRMHAFVRFQTTAEGLYFSVVEPDFNVLPLLADHFEKRYPAQPWLIYDRRRHYGLHYEPGSPAAFVTLAPDATRGSGHISAAQLAEPEARYQTLWQDYFRSVNIVERRNLKLHRRHVPRRYWKYLVEKH